MITMKKKIIIAAVIIAVFLLTCLYIYQNKDNNKYGLVELTGQELLQVFIDKEDASITFALYNDRDVQAEEFYEDLETTARQAHQYIYYVNTTHTTFEFQEIMNTLTSRSSETLAYYVIQDGKILLSNTYKNFDTMYKDLNGKKYDTKVEKMSKEEKQKLLDEKLPYRDGKTRRQRKKEQKADYKDDMLKRKERLDEMKRQFEEDKKFAKENGFKFKSKKQKEQREQELREKEIWYQEQQLLKAQDTDEKVSKIADNVIEFPKQNEKVVDKLQDVQDAITEGFNKLMGKPSEPKEEKPSNVVPFHQGGDYGNVTDEDLNKLHDAGREPEQPTLKGQLKDAWDGFFGEVKDLKETVKKYKNDTDELKNSQGGMVDPSKISDPGLRERIEKLNKKYEGSELNKRVEQKLYSKGFNISEIKKMIEKKY
jgi:hypothetical protein